jgi:hypothetical protein
MNKNDKNNSTIKFHDHGENQKGFIVVRRFEDKVAICLSLEENGDVEALVEKEVVSELLEALKKATMATS